MLKLYYHHSRLPILLWLLASVPWCTQGAAVPGSLGKMFQIFDDYSRGREASARTETPTIIFTSTICCRIEEREGRGASTDGGSSKTIKSTTSTSTTADDSSSLIITPASSITATTLSSISSSQSTSNHTTFPPKNQTSTQITTLTTHITTTSLLPLKKIVKITVEFPTTPEEDTKNGNVFYGSEYPDSSLDLKSKNHIKSPSIDYSKFPEGVIYVDNKAARIVNVTQEFHRLRYKGDGSTVDEGVYKPPKGGFKDLVDGSGRKGEEEMEGRDQSDDMTMYAAGLAALEEQSKKQGAAVELKGGSNILLLIRCWILMSAMFILFG